MIRSISILISSLILTGCTGIAQDPSDCLATHTRFVQEQNDQFASTDESPLPSERLANFKELDYYSYDEDYCLEANWIRTPDEEPFEMATSTDRLPVYVKYGELHFTLDGSAQVLSAYQNIELAESEEYKDYLFVPFNDLTNGDGSYGGGRYMDLTIPSEGTVLIDLNNTYHPYCAYNPKYSCPIPPEENMLNVRIEAGVKLGKYGSIDDRH